MPWMLSPGRTSGSSSRVTTPAVVKDSRNIRRKGYSEIFEALLQFARNEGLISDRLRIKDATHIFADVAIPTSLGLFAQLRDRMLAAIRQFDPDAADVFDSDAKAVREKTADEADESRLA